MYEYLTVLSTNIVCEFCKLRWKIPDVWSAIFIQLPRD